MDQPQPHGTVTILANTTSSQVSAVTNGTFQINDTYATLEALPPRDRPNASWVASLPILNKVRRFNEGSTGANASYLADFAGDTPARITGKPVFEFSEMLTTLGASTASNDNTLIIGDFSNYVINDVVGSTITYEPLVLGSTQKPVGDVGSFLTFRTGADDVSGGNAYRLLVV